MNILGKLFAISAIISCTISISQISAQTFDLSSQRSEHPYIHKVPGEVLDHGGLVINPVPQQMSVTENGYLLLRDGIYMMDIRKTFAKDIDFLKAYTKVLTESPKAVKSQSIKSSRQTTTSNMAIPVIFTIDYGKETAARNGVKQLSGAYSLTIDRDGISIIGYDERGAFYGLQTLRQIFESPEAVDGQLPLLCINDYPNLPVRGVVEGFYGTPWSHEVRLSLIDFYGEFKLNTYFYGPKDDPYHSSPNWRLPYPEDQARNISELVAACKRNRVDFVWAIHPGQDIKWGEEDYGNLVGKFNAMYNLGVRSFAIFFDDISGEGAKPEKQIELLNRLTEEFVKAKGDIEPLMVCPTDYSKLWANPSENGSLAKYGRGLDPSIRVFWTGDYVCSNITKETMEWVGSRIKRPALNWWNFPVTDYARHILMQGPAYMVDSDLTAEDLCGVLSNPMEHGEASKLALYGVADVTWNTAAYNPIDNWNRGLRELMPQAFDAYRTFAIHSCDTETGYRRDESWETEIFYLDTYSDSLAAELRAEFERMLTVEEEIHAGCDNEKLLREISPWLVEFTRLAERGLEALDLMEQYRAETAPASFWRAYTRALMTEEERISYNAHRSGTLKLQPFYEYAMLDMGAGLLSRIGNNAPAEEIRYSSSSADTTAALAFDRLAQSFFTNNGALTIEVPSGSTRVILLLNTAENAAPVTVCQYSRKGKLLSRTTAVADYLELNLIKGTTKLEITGDARIHEVIF